MLETDRLGLRYELTTDNSLSLILSALELRAEYFANEADKLNGFVPTKNDLIGNPEIVQSVFREEAEKSLKLAERVTTLLYGDDDE